MSQPVIIGNATLYLGDCMGILPTVPKVDAVITDPPYGINEAAGKNKSRTNMAVSKDYGNDDWDKAPAPKIVIEHMRLISKWQAIFGGNYFELPPSSCWLVWDKLNGESDFADCELCWTNWPKAVRRLRWRWHGMLREGNEERFHPTQKPLQVMAWVIDLCPKADTILDPFMGSGTTGVAALSRGKAFIGIEREPKYFDIACRRIEQAQKQAALFPPRGSIAQAEQSASAEDARRIAILSAALHIVRSMPDWDARPDGSLEPFAEMMDMALRGEVHDILSFIEYVHATYPVADGAAMKGQP